MTNEELVTEIREGRNQTENMARLWEQNKRFVAKKAHHYRFYAEYDDLMQEGYLALVNAVGKYDPAVGVRFITFASYCLDAVMSRYVSRQNIIRLPVVEYTMNVKYSRAVNAIQADTGREPTRDEIKKALGVDDGKLDQIEKNVCMGNMASLDAVQFDEENRTLAESIPDTYNDIDELVDNLYRQELRKTLWKMVADLPPVQSEVLYKRYEQGQTLKEIEAETGTDWGKVSRIESSALHTLRNGRNGRTLRPFYDVYGAALKGNGAGAFRRTNTSSTERAALELVEP